MLLPKGVPGGYEGQRCSNRGTGDGILGVKDRYPKCLIPDPSSIKTHAYIIYIYLSGKNMVSLHRQGNLPTRWKMRNPKEFHQGRITPSKVEPAGKIIDTSVPKV